MNTASLLLFPIAWAFFAWVTCLAHARLVNDRLVGRDPFFSLAAALFWPVILPFVAFSAAIAWLNEPQPTLGCPDPELHDRNNENPFVLIDAHPEMFANYEYLNGLGVVKSENYDALNADSEGGGVDVSNVVDIKRKKETYPEERMFCASCYGFDFYAERNANNRAFLILRCSNKDCKNPATKKVIAEFNRPDSVGG